jgi:hypothetical protein
MSEEVSTATKEAWNAYRQMKALATARLRVLKMARTQDRVRNGEKGVKAWEGNFFRAELDRACDESLVACMECHGTGCHVDSETGPEACHACEGYGLIAPT